MDTLLVPAYCAVLSVVALLLVTFRGSRYKDDVPTHLEHSNIAIFTWRLVQLLTILTLLGISIHSLLRHDSRNGDLGLGVLIAQCVLYVGRMFILANIALTRTVYSYMLAYWACLLHSATLHLDIARSRLRHACSR